MSTTNMAVTQVAGLRRQQRLQREQIWCLSRSSTGMMIVALFMIGCCMPATTTTAFHTALYSPVSSWQRAFLPIVTKQQLPRQRHGWFKSILSSNNNQWEDDIIISPDLSEYFSKKQTSSSSSSSAATATTDNDNVVVATKSSDAGFRDSSTNTAVSSSSSSSSPLLSVDSSDENDLDDIVNVDDSSIVKEIVTSLQSTIENGSKNKNMIADIMASIQRLQRIQQQWYIRNSDNSIENDDDEKLILMKNPKKRSSNTAANTKKKKGGLAKTTSVTTTTTSVVTSQQQQRSSSSSNSMILQRFLQSNMNDDEISYRLLWVGSDDAISAFGTGLHKVPLARLQEVFISISIPSTKKKLKAGSVNRFRLTTTEVIRILGPFPNIKNTLHGICTISSAPNSSAQKGGEQWNITWDSMIDGTGKELIGRNDDDVRQVPTLQMLYGDEQIIVASIQKEGTATQMDTRKEGTATQMDTRNVDALEPPLPVVESILLFVREMEMDDKLTALRVL